MTSNAPGGAQIPQQGHQQGSPNGHGGYGYPYAQQGHPAFNPPPPAPKKKRRWPWVVLVALVLLVIVIVAVSSGGDGSDTMTTSGSGTGAQAQEKDGARAPAEPSAGIGTPVRDGKFEFTVTDVQRAATVGPEMVAESAQGEFVIVSVTVSNTGNEAQSLDTSSQKLVDAAGKQYSTDTGAQIAMDAENGSSTVYEQINPGNSVDTKLVFDVPTGTEVAKLELHDSPFSGGEEVSLK